MRHLFSEIIIAATGASMVFNLTRELNYEIRIITGIVGLAAIGIWFMVNLHWYGVRGEGYNKRHDDERTKTIFDRSARNAFMIMWLTMFVVVAFGTLEAGPLLIVVASGLAVFGISYYVQLFRGG